MPHLQITFEDNLKNPHVKLTPIDLAISADTAKALTQDVILFDIADAIPHDGMIEEKIGIPVPIIGHVNAFAVLKIKPDPVPAKPTV